MFIDSNDQSQPQPMSPDSMQFARDREMSQVYLYRLDSTDLIEMADAQLRGKVLSQNGKWVQKYKPWANEEGISKIMGVLAACGLNKNITLGNLTHEEIYERCRLIWQKLAYMLCVGYYKYGIEKANKSMLIQLVVQPIHSALSRSELGREAKQLSTQTQHIEQHHSIEQPRHGGLLNFGRRP